MDEETFKRGCQTLWNTVYDLQRGSGEARVSLQGENWIESIDHGLNALTLYKQTHEDNFYLIQPYFDFFEQFIKISMGNWQNYGDARVSTVIPQMAERLKALLGGVRVGSNPWPALHTLVRLLERL
jgi:hypothetical protein